MNLQALARLGLFGSKGGKAKPTLWKCIVGDFLRYVMKIETGLPSVIDQAWYYADVVYSAFFGPEAETLPHDFPVKLFATIDKVLLSRGGMFDRETEQRNFWIEIGGCKSDPLAWFAKVEYHGSADPRKLATFEESLEDALDAAGFNVNVNITTKPRGLRIDKPEPPVIALADYWPSIGALPKNELWAAPGVKAGNDGLILMARQFTGESFSARIVGRPRAGKTQIALSLLLSVAYANGPDFMSMIIVDPKVVDMMFLATLPHLACPVVTRASECKDVMKALITEMEDREERLRTGDRSFLQKYIFVYVDELADLQESLKGNDREDVIVAIQRLTQKGGGLGFIVIGATQRVFALDARIYSSMNDRYALAANNASDGVSATGVAGVQVHKLPGKGACELHPDNVRLQGFFVADAKADDYPKRIGRFVADIRGRWGNQSPHWKIGSNPQPKAAEEVAELGDDKFFNLLADAYDSAPPKFSGRVVRNAHQEAFGRGCDGTKAARIRSAFLTRYAGVVDVVG